MDVIDLIFKRGFLRTESGCLEFQGYRNQLGYGQVRVRSQAGRLVRVHRAMYEHYTGEKLADDAVILHRCDNPPCAAREHLVAGTQAENLADMRAKGRHYKGDWSTCPNGHPYGADRPPSSSKNRCRQCARDRNKRYWQRKRGGSPDLAVLNGAVA